MANEEVKKTIIDGMKDKIEESKGNINEELVEAVKEASKEEDENPMTEKAKIEAEAATFGMTPEELVEHKKSVEEFNAEVFDEEEAEAEFLELFDDDPRGILDKALGKFASRKLLVWGVATAALFYARVPADQWVTISAVYIGSQAAVDIFKVLKGIK